MKDDTTIVHAGRKPFDNHGIVNPPVYHASTVLFPTVEAWEDARERRDEPGTVVYGRRGTPTTFALQDAMADLEGADRCLAVPSGMAAIAVPLLAFLDPGDHMLMVDAVYYPARRLADTLLARMGVDVPAGMTVVVVENTWSLTHLVLPPQPDVDALDDATLERVATGDLPSTVRLVALEGSAVDYRLFLGAPRSNGDGDTQ